MNRLQGRYRLPMSNGIKVAFSLKLWATVLFSVVVSILQARSRSWVLIPSQFSLTISAQNQQLTLFLSHPVFQDRTINVVDTVAHRCSAVNDACFPYIGHSTTVQPLMNVAMQNADGIQHVSHPTTNDADASLLSVPDVPFARFSANCVRWRATDMPDVIAGRNRFAAAVRHRQPIRTKQLPSTS